MLVKRLVYKCYVEQTEISCSEVHEKRGGDKMFVFKATAEVKSRD